MLLATSCSANTACICRSLCDVARLNKAPSAMEAVKRIDALFEIERDINGKPPPERQRVRDEHSPPLVAELKTWLQAQRAKLSAHSETAKAIRYTFNRWNGLVRFLDDGRLCMTNNAAERALRYVAVGRHNWTFAGSDEGGRRAAAIYTLVQCQPADGRLLSRCVAGQRRNVVGGELLDGIIQVAGGGPRGRA
jgi:transposase